LTLDPSGMTARCGTGSTVSGTRHTRRVGGQHAWCEADYPLTELLFRPTRQTDRRIAPYVGERIPDGATLQAGIGAIPNEC
jgi:acyl-CoA hydrolase